MVFKKEELSAIQQENENLRLYNLYEKGKAIKHVWKHAESQDLKVFDEVHINIVIITL